MISIQTKLLSADNCGAQYYRCIGLLKDTKKCGAAIGDVITVVPANVSPQAKIKKKQVYRAVIVRTAFPVKRSDGSVVRFNSNAAVLITSQGDPIGTRVFGPVGREIRQKKFLKVASLASGME